MMIKQVNEKWYTIDGYRHGYVGTASDFCVKISDTLQKIEETLEGELYDYLAETRVFPRSEKDRERLAVLVSAIENNIDLCGKAVQAINLNTPKETETLSFKTVKTFVGLHTELYNTSHTLLDSLR